MPRVRVLVVEDSLTVRRRLVDILSADPEVEVVGEAGDGKSAIELCQKLRPSVVTLDMMLPLLSGLATTEHIMAYCPTPILIVSSSTNRGELFKTYEALAAGALEVLEKPTGEEVDGAWEHGFLATVKLISRIKVITHPRGRLWAARPPDPAGAAAPLASPAILGRRVVAIGASTGGPGALIAILRALPLDFPLPVLVVLHLGAAFAAAFGDWLGGETGHRVTYARDGEPLVALAGRIVLAPPDRHLVARGAKVHLTDGPERHSCRPSIDVLFESLAREHGAATAACLLTGMGRDGAAGLLELRRAGGLTIAQDEATSVVYGMPKEAALLGAAERILPLGEIGAALARLARTS